MISALTGEFKQEAANTRKLLERVPQESFSWKPHEKSMTLLRLALHIVEMIRWVPFAVQQTELDFSKDYPKSPDVKSTTELLSFFD